MRYHLALLCMSCLVGCSVGETELVESEDGGRAPRDAGRADTSLPDVAADTSAAPDASVPGAGHDADASEASDAGDAAPVDADASDAHDASGDARDAEAGVPNDPIGVWHFDENTGTMAADSSGNNHTATLMGNAGWAPGKMGAGLSLGGAGYADLGAAVLSTTQSFSLSCWVAFTNLGGWPAMISQDATELSAFTLKRRDDNAKLDFDFPGQDNHNPTIWSIAQSTTVPSVGPFYHLGAVYDAAAAKLSIFVNGQLEDTQPTAVILAGTGHTVIGRAKWQGVSASYLQGVIDEVQLFQRALSAAEVRAIYDAQK